METEIQPYRVQASRRTVGEITDQYNDALYRSYGPDHSLKSGPVQITVDALCEYERLLDTLVEMGAEGAPLAEMHDQPCPPDKIICGIRHDLDMDFRASLDMAKLEQERGIRSSWYILHTAPYYGQLDESGVFHRNESMASVYLQLQEMGHEVALHIDPLHLYQNERINGAEALVAELEWMRSIGLDVVGSAAHNMVSTYNAENYAIFKGRPLSGGELKGESPTEAIKDGKWAPVGIVDESELGLTYEANDLFHQGHTSVYYAAIRGLDRWRRVEEMSAPLAGKRDDLTKGFTDTATVLKELRAVERGRFIILAIHPIYYGARHSSMTGPSRFCSINGSARSATGWMAYPAGGIQARCGQLESGRQEFQAINLANEHGQLDLPFQTADEKADLRVLLFGSGNLDGASVGVPAQTHVRLRDGLMPNKDSTPVQVWKFAAPEMGVSRWFSQYESVKERCRPTHVVLGIGGDELLRSLPEFWRMVCGSDPGVPPGSYLSADKDGAVREVPAGRGASAFRGVPQAVPDDAPLFHREFVACHGGRLKRLESILRYWKEACERDGVQLCLLLENCGETVDSGLPGDVAALSEAHGKTINILRPIAESVGAQLIDPYPDLLLEKSDAFYRSQPDWSPRGHAIAAGALIRAFKQFQGDFAKFSSSRLARVKAGRSLTTDSRPTEKELSEMEQVAADAGVRSIPYPFRNALTVTSDIDKSNSDKYRGYIGALVQDFGFDFGDSVWLTASFISGRRRAKGHTGMAFFTPWFTHFEEEWPGANILDSLELAEEHHRGNIDHWHSFLRRGPRFALAGKVERQSDGSVLATLPEVADPRPASDHKSGRDYFDTRDFYVLAVTVIGEWERQDAPAQVTILARDLEDEITLFPGRDPLDEADGVAGSHLCFVAKIEANGARSVPHLDQVESVSIQFEGGSSQVSRVILHNTHPDLFHGRLDYLARQFHFSTNLVTRHSLFHFLPAIPGFGGNGQGRANLQRMEKHPNVLDTYYGSLFDLGIPASTSADEPGSFARVYPQQMAKNGLRFLRTAAIDYPTTLRTAAAQKAQAMRGKKEDREKKVTSDSVEAETTGWHPSVFGVAFPMLTRYGGSLYHLRSTHSRLADKDAVKSSGKALARKTIARNFTNRLRSVVDDLKSKSGRAAQFYTHLGNLAPDDNTIPTPYFDQGDLRHLQDRILGCGQDSSNRIWFTRGSILSDFSLVLQSIGYHVTRPDGNTIAIDSWNDPYLGVKVGETPEELYGQTFFVEDSSSAVVTLDGETIEEIARNGADETGEQSVTIAASPIRHTVFHAIDPRVRVGNSVDWEERGLQSEWNENALSLKPEAGSEGQLRFFPGAIEPFGSQHLVFRLRRTGRSAFTLVIETETGGKFAFGDEAAVESISGDLDATYLVPDLTGKDDDWHTVVVPFHDLNWCDGAKGLSGDQIRPLPSHRPKSIEIGVNGEGVEIAAMEYTRPKTTRPNTESPEFVKIGGKVAPDLQDHVFELRSSDDDQVVAEARPNTVGHLIFDAVPKGGYRLCRAGDSADTFQWIEAFADRFDIRI